MKRLTLFFIYVVLSSIAYAQGSSDAPPPGSVRTTDLTLKDILKGDRNITHLGIDLSQTKFIGPVDEWSENVITAHNLAWNELWTEEIQNWKFYTQVFRIMPDMFLYRDDICIDHNEGVDFKNSIDYSSSRKESFTDAQISRIVSQYDYDNISGVGLMIIVEAFDAFDRRGYMNLTFIDLDNKAVIHSEKLVGKGRGAGIRNYWKYSIEQGFVEVRENIFKQWLKQYNMEPAAKYSKITKRWTPTK